MYASDTFCIIAHDVYRTDNNNIGCGERVTHKTRCMGIICEKPTPVYWNRFEDYWRCAGGRSVVSAIGTQSRDPMHSELTR